MRSTIRLLPAAPRPVPVAWRPACRPWRARPAVPGPPPGRWKRRPSASPFYGAGKPAVKRRAPAGRRRTDWSAALAAPTSPHCPRARRRGLTIRWRPGECRALPARAGVRYTWATSSGALRPRYRRIRPAGPVTPVGGRARRKDDPPMLKDAQTPVIAEPREHHTLVTPARVLMAPGPTNLPPAVQQSLLAPLVGHKDPAYLRVMDDTAELLRAVFLTRNAVSIALPGTGGA